MIRVYFVFEDPNDDELINLSYIDVSTADPGQAFLSVQTAAESGELWKNMYPNEGEHLYRLITSKMMYLDISALQHEHRAETTLHG
ncbi:MAG: hypothetical protein WB562_10390 [Candidatus Sulfotelmatobacter sp.]